MTAAWLDLLPYMDPENFRELLGERSAFECHQRRVGDVHEPTTWGIVAEVLAEIHGVDPMEMVR